MRMLCSRSASLMTSTRGSRAIATIILRIVSASAASPYLTLSSLVTPSTRCATSAPKSRLTSLQRVAGVLDRVVQQGGDQRGGVHAELGQDRGHRQRVGDVRVAALAQLAAVLLPRRRRTPAAGASRSALGWRGRWVATSGSSTAWTRTGAGRPRSAGGRAGPGPGAGTWSGRSGRPGDVGRLGARRRAGAARPGSGCVGFGSASNSASSLTSTSSSATTSYSTGSPHGAAVSGAADASGAGRLAAVGPASVRLPRSLAVSAGAAGSGVRHRGGRSSPNRHAPQRQERGRNSEPLPFRRGPDLTQCTGAAGHGAWPTGVSPIGATSSRSGYTASTACSSTALNRSRPPSAAELDHHRHPGQLPPARPTRSTAAASVPPVASTSSTSSTLRCPAKASVVHLHHRLAVLQLVRGGDGVPRQLAGLADRDDAGVRDDRDRRREQEAARLDPGDDVEPGPRVLLRDRARDLGEQRTVGEQRGEVLEHDPRLREVRDVAAAARRPVPPDRLTGASWPTAGRRRRASAAAASAGGPPAAACSTRRRPRRPPGWPAPPRPRPPRRPPGPGRAARRRTARPRPPRSARHGGTGSRSPYRRRPSPWPRACDRSRPGSRPAPRPPAAARPACASARYFGSRSLRSHTIGVARKIEEYAPAARPTNSTSARSLIVPTPSSPAPTNSSPATGSSAISEVLIERISVWLTARLAASD